MYLTYNIWEWMHNSMLFLSLMIENLSLSCVLNSPLGHRIHRKSIWKKTILKTKITRVLSLVVHACRGTCVCSLNPVHAGLTMCMHAVGQKNPSRLSLVENGH